MLRRGNPENFHLSIATISFALCFACWGLVSGLAAHFKAVFSLSSSATSWMIALPVILGALARIPVGAISDRWGAKRTLVILMFVCSGILFASQLVSNQWQLMLLAFSLGLAGSSFAAGANYVSAWTSPRRQGSALGIFGIGNIGQSLAVGLSPLAANYFSWQTIFISAGAILLVWSLLFATVAKEPPEKGAVEGTGFQLLKEPSVWLLAFFYFLTFGGFVSFAIYLPVLLTHEFGLEPSDAGLRCAFFVILATVFRPLGGWLSDHIGGARLLAVVFAGISFFALLMAWPSLIPFTVGALGCAALLGVGNGAVFKLVAEIYPGRIGLASGVVGAFGGLGGFFPPLLLGYSKQYLGTVWPAFGLLALTAVVAYWLIRKKFSLRQQSFEKSLTRELGLAAVHLRAGAYATLLASMLAAAIVVGSRKLQNFDPALVIYTFATVFATWGITYHYYFWLQKPPTKRYWNRGIELFLTSGVSGVIKLISVAITHLFAQTFIRRRSRYRWVMHQCLFWGCNIAAAVTFPLVFGWIHFGTRPDNQSIYVAYTFGFPTMEVPTPSIMSWLLFHVLDFAAVLVLAGVGLAVYRRMRDKGALAVQTFSMDFFPLFLLAAISVTGLALTASTIWFRGAFFDFLSILHAITVITSLLYLPFGKFFHIFQRPAQLGVKLYHDVGSKGDGALCARCGERFASRLHIDDLNEVLPELGFDYSMDGPAKTWQEICPPCKRKSLGSAILRMREQSYG
jgi:MFS transporter, NNP family, nitrate/nitrite transporter